MRIFTGAPMPDGADAVVMVERTERRPTAASAVEIEVAVGPGDHVRAAGEDLQAGDVVFGAGDDLTPARSGVLASLGVGEVVAHPRPRVGVLSTGDELVVRRRPLRPGQIRDSNRPALLALVAQAGSTPSTSASCATTRPPSPPPSSGAWPRATRSSPAAACRWATSTWSRWCSTASATCAGCRWRSGRPSRWPSVPARRRRCRCSASRATRCRRW